MKALFLISLLSLSLQSPAGPLISSLVDQTGNLVITDSFGRSLYVFDRDSVGASNCNAKCAEVWPPYLLVSGEEPILVGNPDLSAIQRESNLVQLAYKGRPVYTYMSDRAPGDVKGDGLGNVWHKILVGR